MDLRLDVDERLRHLNAPAGDIDAIPPEAEELAEAEPSEAGEESICSSGAAKGSACRTAASEVGDEGLRLHLAL